MDHDLNFARMEKKATTTTHWGQNECSQNINLVAKIHTDILQYTFCVSTNSRSLVGLMWNKTFVRLKHTGQRSPLQVRLVEIVPFGWWCQGKNLQDLHAYSIYNRLNIRCYYSWIFQTVHYAGRGLTSKRTVCELSTVKK